MRRERSNPLRWPACLMILVIACEFLLVGVGIALWATADAEANPFAARTRQAIEGRKLILFGSLLIVARGTVVVVGAREMLRGRAPVRAKLGAVAILLPVEAVMSLMIEMKLRGPAFVVSPRLMCSGMWAWIGVGVGLWALIALFRTTTDQRDSFPPRRHRWTNPARQPNAPDTPDSPPTLNP